MAFEAAQKKALRSLSWLGAIFVVLIGILGLGVATDPNAAWTPKLALDLEGGTQIILTPRLAEGQTVSAEQLEQAVSIIRQRVDASGVSEAEISTQGGTNIVVSLPGQPDEATMERLQASAQLTYRPVFDVEYSAIATPSPTPPANPTTPPTEEPVETPTDIPAAAWDTKWITPELQKKFDEYVCTPESAQAASVADPSLPVIACESDGVVKYLLGPQVLSGEQISDAYAAQETSSTGIPLNSWSVVIQFNNDGTGIFADVTRALISLPAPRNQFAIIIDGSVLMAPRTNYVITDGRPQITSTPGYTQENATFFANQLKYGALPFSFTIESNSTIAATLGSYQLTAGLIAGAIGLGLVVIYSLIQYRVLGATTIISLIIAAALTYLVITILSWRQGYRLSLAGVAGLIVAIGITADSFIVYFERIRDELREGKFLNIAVENGWRRALRTILASDAVNFLGAAVLYILAVGSVRGFAFTLGITTLIDIVVVSLFTHPVLQLIARWRFFKDGHPLSGLDPKALGAVYRGRAQFRAPAPAIASVKATKSSKEAQKRQTIAERKAQEEAAKK